jgi:Omp85 superfamily domain
MTGTKAGILRRLSWCLGLGLLIVPATVCADTHDETPVGAGQDPELVNTLSDLGEKYGQGFRYGAPPAVFESGGANPYQDAVPANPASSDMPTGKKEQKGEIIAAPIPSLNPTFGWGLGVVTMYVYQPLEDQKDAPPWTTGLAGAYTENGSWGALGFHKMNLEQDTWRLLSGAGYASFNYDFFGIGTDAGNAGASIPLNQSSWGAIAEAMRRVWPHLYVGLRYTYANTRTRLDNSDATLGTNFPPLSQIELNAQLSAIGLRIQYDTRDNEFYPTDGTLFDLKANYYGDFLGSDFDFRSTTLSYSRYLAITEGQVLALRGVAEFESDNAPFFALSTYGSHSDLRGYQSGQYRDRYLLAAQGEYRLKLTKRVGVVGFAGVGGVADSLGNFKIEDLLPSVGGGLRFQLSEQNPINFRVDIARGKDDTAVYVGIGEAF